MVAGLFVFRIGPVIAAFIMSFMRWNVRTSPSFVGPGNYIEAFTTDQFFWQVLRV